MIYRILLKREYQDAPLRHKPWRRTIRYDAFFDDKSVFISEVKWANSQWSNRPWDWAAFQSAEPVDSGTACVETYFWFNHLDDALLFKLTWGGSFEEVAAYNSIMSAMGSL